MLQELSMVEQRYLAVREVLDTAANVNDVAATRVPNLDSLLPLAYPRPREARPEFYSRGEETGRRRRRRSRPDCDAFRSAIWRSLPKSVLASLAASAA